MSSACIDCGVTSARVLCPACRDYRSQFALGAGGAKGTGQRSRSRGAKVIVERVTVPVKVRGTIRHGRTPTPTKVRPPRKGVVTK